MDLGEFRKSLRGKAPPEGSNRLLQALWHEANGEWGRAHKLAQSQKGKAAAAVHAYLHRKEGNLSNAGYWYERAGRERPRGPLEKEWEALVIAQLNDGKE